jgi:hypothetical protein
MSIRIQSVPFVSGYRMVITDPDDLDGGVAVIESLCGLDDAGEPTRSPEVMFPCRSNREALGIACAFAATIINRVDIARVVEGLSSSRVKLPGDHYFMQINSTGDGRYSAIVEERGDAGQINVVDRYDDADNFFDAYGWSVMGVTASWQRDRGHD